MPTKREVLECLTRDELQWAVEEYDLSVEDRRVREQLVDALATSRKSTLEAVLPQLARDRLKEICSELGLSDLGRDKDTLADRLMNAEGGMRRSEHEEGSQDIASGDVLRDARLAAGLSQAEVAERLAVSQATVSNWENGRGSPTAEQTTALGGFLSLPNRKRGVRGADRGEDAPDGVSAFGVWVARSRNAAGLTITELANRANVSPAQLSNIETGTTQNPRSATRDRIVKALGQPAPEEAIQATEREAEVANLGSLVDFDPHDEDELPTDPGVYVFYDVSNRPIYVGQGANIRARVRDHAEKFWFKRPIVDQAAYIKIPEKQLREQVEQILIKFLKSNAVINRQHVERG